MLVLKLMFLLGTASAFTPIRPAWSGVRRQDTPLGSSSLFIDVPGPLRTKLEERFTAPTPIQAATWGQREAGSLLLFAPTGSGKTLAYMVTALWRRGEQATAATQDQAVEEVSAASGSDVALERTPSEQAFERALLVVAPTRELAVQLAADLRSVLPEAGKGIDGEGSVQLAVAGGAFPPSEALARCAALVGTPSELLMTLKAGGIASRKFVSELDAIILDEADVLLPPPPKVRGSGPAGNRIKSGRGGSSSDSGGGPKKKSKEPDLPTVKLLRYMALHNDKDDFQVLAGSATASRQTMARLDSVLRQSDISAGTRLGWRGGRVKAVRCEPAADASTEGSSHSNDEGNASTQGQEGDPGGNQGAAGARAVTVPSAVAHRYVCVPKAKATDAGAALSAVVDAMRRLQPRSSLLFVCGAFAPASTAALEAAAAKANTPAAQAAALRSAKKNKKSGPGKGMTSAERAKLRAREKRAARKAAAADDGLSAILGSSSGSSLSGVQTTTAAAAVTSAGLSARRACAALNALGVEAAPLHVALGLASEKAAQRDGGVQKNGNDDGEGDHEGDASFGPGGAAAVAHKELAARFASLASSSEETTGTTGDGNTGEGEGAPSAAAASSSSSTSGLGPCLVTFEGSARGLHFDGVDAVFVVGRPSSSSAYLHLAGRVGRLSPKASSSSSPAPASSSVVPRPGTVVSVCTTRGARELQGWVTQIGGQDLRPLDGTVLLDEDEESEVNGDDEEVSYEEDDEDATENDF